MKTWQWIKPRLALSLLLVVAFVVVMRLSEVIAPPEGGERRVVVDLPAGDCPTGQHPNAIKCEVNAIRRANGLQELETNHLLRKAARAHA